VAVRGHSLTQADADQLAEIAELLKAGKVKPVIHATYKLADAAKAETALANEHVRGKIVLTINL
jgi:NADPH:quinone reductase-like Zn-dependent oxidoreductase